MTTNPVETDENTEDTSNTSLPGEDGNEAPDNLAQATTPHYNQPEDADRFPVAVPNPLPAHTVFKGDPRVDGPYLDDWREAQDDARRRQGHVHAATVAIQKEKQEAGNELREDLKKAAELNPSFASPVEPDENDITTGINAETDVPSIGDAGLEPGGSFKNANVDEVGKLDSGSDED